MTSTLTKLEHSSLVLEHKGKRIAFDPGGFTKQSDALKNVDILVLTHAHSDHLHLENVKFVQENASELTIITNAEVAGQLKAEGIEATILEGHGDLDVGDITFHSDDFPHEEIYGDFGQVQNTGYVVDDVFFHPGDAFAKPHVPVKMIAVPINAPFMRIKGAIEYMDSLADISFIGVHDGMVIPPVAGMLKGIISGNVSNPERYHQVAAGESVEL